MPKSSTQHSAFGLHNYHYSKSSYFSQERIAHNKMHESKSILLLDCGL